MTDVEIVVFNDKSWVRLTDYQKLKDRYEALEETKEYQNDAICRLQKQIEKMKCCSNCVNERDMCLPRSRKLYCSNWRLAE